MRFFKSLAKGAAAAVSSYKLILVVWVTMLVLALAVGFPLRSFLNGIFGNSMAVTRLNDGFDLGLAGDMGKPFGALLAAASAGTVLAGTAGFFIMTFFAGGLFRRFTMAWGGIRVSDFLRASASNFVPFLKIALLVMIIIGGYTLLVIGVPSALIAVLSVNRCRRKCNIFLLCNLGSRHACMAFCCRRIKKMGCCHRLTESFQGSWRRFQGPQRKILAFLRNRTCRFCYKCPGCCSHFLVCIVSNTRHRHNCLPLLPRFAGTDYYPAFNEGMEVCSCL